MSQAPKILVVTPFLGAHSEVWLWRQIVGFRCCHPSVLAWEVVNGQTFPTPGISVDPLGIDFNLRRGRIQRMAGRAKGVMDYNFCGPSTQEAKAVHKCLNRIQPDAILCHFGYTALRILPIIKPFKVPLIVHFHGRDISASLQNKWYRWSLKHSAKYISSAIVVGSHQHKKLIDEYHIPKERVHLIPCGVDTDFFNPAPRKHHPTVRFISVGRLSPEKGLDYSIRAFSVMARRHDRSEYRIVGDGIQKSALQHLVRELNIQEKIHFLGSQDPARVRALMNESDVFLQHSVKHAGWVEGFGVSIAEASACQLPVIATNSGGIADQIKDGFNGFLVPEKDVESMAEKMLLLAGDPELRSTLGHNGRKRAVENYDTKSQIQKLEAVLITSLNYEQ